jgi:F0F1-type ATP synthase beta subunit
VAQYLEDDLVRCFAQGDAASVAPRPGARVGNAGTTEGTLDAAALGGIVAGLRSGTPSRTPLETGIKVIDLFTPLAAGSLVGLAGDMRSGKMVLVEELIQRLGDLERPLSILVFVHAPEEIGGIQELEYRTSGSVQALYLPVADASPEALATVTGDLDAVITLSREMGREGLWPAIDPLRSSSRLLDAEIVGREQVAVVERARELLRDAGTSARANALRRYLTQPFVVAEPFTKRAGATVSRDRAIADLDAILRGEHDDWAEALYMIGALAG